MTPPITDTPPKLFDRSALEANRARARALPDGPALFLHEAVHSELRERLEEVNRSFSDLAVITGFSADMVDFPGGTVRPDAERLDLEPGAHDAVLHVLGLHWAADPVGQLVQCRHALRPDGLLIAALFGGETLHELRTVLTEAEAQVTGGLSPRVAPMGELRDLGGLLQRAGFALPVADTVPLTVTYESAFHLMRDLRAMGETNAMADRLRHPTRRSVLLEAARLYSDRYGLPNGRIPATFEIAYLTGWAPDASQPQPLRPGSATHKLSDVLNATDDHANRSDD